MTARIIRFDEHHASFAGRSLEPSGLDLEIYLGGTYLGALRVKPQHIDAYDASWCHLGQFPAIEDANAAVIASFGFSCQGTA